MGKLKWWLEVIGDIASMGAFSFLLFVLVTIAMNGGYMFAVEHQMWILIPEIIGTVLLILFMGWHFWIDTGRAVDPYQEKQMEQAMRNNNDKDKNKA